MVRADQDPSPHQCLEIRVLSQTGCGQWMVGDAKARSHFTVPAGEDSLEK